jgi:uncharacterized protein YndB with AHSA1/START domain
MNAIKDEIRIAASASKVYEALVSQAGYRRWWNAAGEVAEVVGGTADLHFIREGKPVNMRFRIDEMNANESVRWTCVGNDSPTWIGTTLNWRIREAGGEVLLTFGHDGWKEAPPEMIAQSWKHFLGSLKSYVETGTGQPW